MTSYNIFVTNGKPSEVSIDGAFGQAALASLYDTFPGLEEITAASTDQGLEKITDEPVSIKRELILKPSSKAKWEVLEERVYHMRTTYRLFKVVPAAAFSSNRYGTVLKAETSTSTEYMHAWLSVGLAETEDGPYK